jgi:hypothetical protein
VAEPALAVRRSILLTLLLAAGGLAAALPALLGEPENEHPALRGLAALLIAFLAATFQAARWGRRGPLEPKAHLLELAKIAIAVTTLLLPALFVGMTTSETEALATLAQRALGWKKPIAAGTLALWLLTAAYVVSRLRTSKGKRWLAVAVCRAARRSRGVALGSSAEVLLPIHRPLVAAFRRQEAEEAAESTGALALAVSPSASGCCPLGTSLPAAVVDRPIRFRRLTPRRSDGRPTFRLFAGLRLRGSGGGRSAPMLVPDREDVVGRGTPQPRPDWRIAERLHAAASGRELVESDPLDN